ncbi:MAG: aldo/keto reductase family protein [Bacteroidia bacterium]|nr:aldo/keto reductase family protein [Bacteroidia bacterium]MDW8302661.1 aldo/keto reductase family protein [Bacteroidia bacterium]
MKYKNLGKSGLICSQISIGSWLTYGFGVEDTTAFRCLDTAIDLGINVIDTADVYNRGEAERIIGNYLKTKNRHEIVLATKVFGPMSDHFMSQGLSARHIRNACEASLMRLHTDYIDLYQCHRYDIDTPLEETCYAMHRLIEEGKILYWGVSQWSAVQILNAIRICEKNNWRKPISNQPVYNMLNRSLEIDVMGVCEQEGLGLMVYSPLAQGLLTGKYTQENPRPKNSRAASEKMGKMFPTQQMTEKFYTQIDMLKKIAAELGCTLAQLALAWCLRKTPVTSCIIGATQPEQIEENVKAVEIILSAEIIQEIENILDNHPRDQYTGALIGHGIIKRGY